MSKKHLTFDDRLAIQAGLQNGLKVARIAKNLGKDRATVGREIKAHRRLVSTSNGNNCVHHKTCSRIPDCRSGCYRGKRQCQTACGGCQEGCPDYREEFCSDYEKSPFVCNACDHRLRCRLRRMLYDAKYAQEQYEKTLSESRRGIAMTEQELEQINDTVSPLLKKGQSLSTICERYRDELPVTERTLYSLYRCGFAGRQKHRPAAEAAKAGEKEERPCPAGRPEMPYRTNL